MEELINEILSNDDLKKEIMYVEFQYHEIKGLLKHFLTLISATLVFSVTFSEKIIDFSNAPKSQKFALYFSWSFFILSLGFCGYGLHTNYLAAEKALKRINNITEESFANLAELSNFLQGASAILYSMGLTLLITTALFKIKKIQKAAITI